MTGFVPPGWHFPYDSSRFAAGARGRDADTRGIRSRAALSTAASFQDHQDGIFCVPPPLPSDAHPHASAGPRFPQAGSAF